MPDNSNGIFTRIYNWEEDAANGLPISASRMDTDTDDIATALSNRICKNGTSTITADIPMNLHKFTGLADGVNDGDSVNYGQIAGLKKSVINLYDIDGFDFTGTTNSAVAFNAALTKARETGVLCIEIPPNVTILIGPYESETGTLLYLGTNGGLASLNGLEIFGHGPSSVIKLADDVGVNALLFGASSVAGDSLSNMYFHDFAMDGNAANNLNASFDPSAPLRYNMGFYFFCHTSNMRFERLYMHDFSGSQWISIGDGNPAHYSNDIRVIDCDFYNFGLAITGNLLPDCSVVYIEGNRIKVIHNDFICAPFTFAPSHGHTACELHGDTSTIVVDNSYEYVQLPVLISSQGKATSNNIVAHNTFEQCNYMVALDDFANNQTRIDIHDNIFYSTVAKSSSILSIGYHPDTAALERQLIKIHDNIIDCVGNTNPFVNFMYLASDWLRSVEVYNNNFNFLPGAALCLIGTIEDNNYEDLILRGNRIDSCGAYPGTGNPFNQPVMIYINTSPGAGSGTINSLVIEGNTLLNTGNYNYSTYGLFYIEGNVNYTRVQNQTNQVNQIYPLVKDLITNAVSKTIESSYYKPCDYRTGVTIGSGPSGVITLANFTGSVWGSNDNAMFDLELWIGPNSAGSSVGKYFVSWTASGGNVTQIALTGSYTGSVSVSFSGTSLQVEQTSGGPLNLFVNIRGFGTQPIQYLL